MEKTFHKGVAKNADLLFIIVAESVGRVIVHPAATVTLDRTLFQNIQIDMLAIAV